MAPVDPVATCSTQITLMCCSAQVEAACQKLIRMIGATLSLQEFAVLYSHDPDKKRPKAAKLWMTHSEPAPARQSGACGPRSTGGAGPRATFWSRNFSPTASVWPMGSKCPQVESARGSRPGKGFDLREVERLGLL